MDASEMIWVYLCENLKRPGELIGKLVEPVIKFGKVVFCPDFAKFKIGNYLPCYVSHESQGAIFAILDPTVNLESLSLLFTLNKAREEYKHLVNEDLKKNQSIPERIIQDPQLTTESIIGKDGPNYASVEEWAAYVVAYVVKVTKNTCVNMLQATNSRADEILAAAQSLLFEAVRSATEKAEEQVARVIAEKMPRRIEIVINHQKTGELPEMELLHCKFERVLKRAVAGVPILLVGPTGSGKTHLGGQLAKALKRSFHCVSITAGQSEGVLGGRLLPVGEHGKFEYIMSEFVKAYEEGGVFGADEFDAGDPNVLVLVNSALANGYMSIPNRYTNPVAKQHKDFVFIAMANTFCRGADRQYTARNELDTSTVNRVKLGTVFIDYDPNLEGRLIPKNILVWGHKMREVIKTHSLRRVCSTRDMIYAGKLEAVGVSVPDWKESYFADWKQDELDKVPRELIS